MRRRADARITGGAAIAAVRGAAGALLAALVIAAMGAAADGAPAGGATGGGATPAADYHLYAEPVATGVWIVEGARQNFDRRNGGAIANSAILAAPDGAIVIDTGTSRLYGEQLRALAAQVTGKDVAAVLVTHAHPDHFLGNQAFAGRPIYALPGTVEAIARNGNALADNMYRLVGGWMRGTVPVVPDHPVEAGEITLAGRSLRLIALDGHTAADLAILDPATGTLITGDLAFHGRAPAATEANLAHWLASLDTLAGIGARLLVPGHGPAARDPSPLDETRAYVRWLGETLRSAADRGTPLPDVMRAPVPNALRALALADEEYPRAVVSLYPPLEEAALGRAGP